MTVGVKLVFFLELLKSPGRVCVSWNTATFEEALKIKKKKGGGKNVFFSKVSFYGTD